MACSNHSPSPSGDRGLRLCEGLTGCQWQNQQLRRREQAGLAHGPYRPRGNGRVPQLVATTLESHLTPAVDGVRTGATLWLARRGNQTQLAPQRAGRQTAQKRT